MGRRNFILGILATLVMCWGQVTWAEVQLLKGREARALHSAKTIYVDVTASTWKTRGRLLYDIEVAVRVKLASVGLTVVRTSQEQLTHKTFAQNALTLNKYTQNTQNTHTPKHINITHTHTTHQHSHTH